MAMQHTATIQLPLVGDGVSTTFTFGFSKLFDIICDSGAILNQSTLPTSATLIGVSGTLPSGSASIDVNGNLVLTFNSAWGNGVTGIASVQLFFNSGTLSAQSAAWTSATVVDTALTATLEGAMTVLVPISVTGTISAGTLAFQASADGVSWYAMQGSQPSNFQLLEGWNLSAGNTAALFNVAGFAYFRVLLAVAIAGTGTATFIIQGMSVPANVISAGGVGTYNSSAPFTTAGTSTPMQLDAYGNLFVNNIRRSQVVPVTGNIASTAAATLCAAPGAGVYADLSTLVLTLREGTTANTFFGVNVSDGTHTYRFNFLSQDVATFQSAAPLVVEFDPPLPATNADTAWTIALTSATDAPSVDYVATFVKQQVS